MLSNDAAVSHALVSPIDELRGESGMFTMVAVDQRDSLRAMLRPADGTRASDEQLIGFKRDVARTMSTRSSAILLDQQYGELAAEAASCPVILAADVLSASRPGGPVDTATIDESVTEETVARFGARALKMLVPWLPDARSEAIDLSHRFLEVSRRLGLPGIVEGVVRPHDNAEWSSERRAEAIVEAARDLGSTKPDLYKGEVVYSSDNDASIATTAAREITSILEVPWVVLSAGVRPEDFPNALASACAGGASGFLAGRAVWGPSASAQDPAADLALAGLSALETLIDVAREATQ